MVTSLRAEGAGCCAGRLLVRQTGFVVHGFLPLGARKGQLSLTGVLPGDILLLIFWIFTLSCAASCIAYSSP